MEVETKSHKGENTIMSETKDLLKAKLILIQPGANIFGGGIWNRKNDLNWAFQQIRPSGKPAGDIPKFNQEAEKMLKEFIPTLEPTKGGELVKEVHALTYQYIDELCAELEGEGYSKYEALKKARQTAFNL